MYGYGLDAGSGMRAMSKTEIDGLLEAGFGLLVIVVALAVIVDSLGLPVSVREPLGSASVPRVVCGLVIMFSLVLVARGVRAFRGARRGREALAPGDAAPGPPAPYRRRTDLGLVMLVLAIAFVASMQTRAVSSVILIPAFLFAGILVLNGFRGRTVLPAILVAVLLGAATHYTFRDFFYVDLP